MMIEQQTRKLKLDTVSSILKYIILIFFSLIILIPIILTVLAGFKTVGQLNADPVGFPDPIVWQNYANIFTKSSFFIYFFNSTIIMLFTVFLDIVIGAFAGFALSRFQIRGKGIIFQYLLLGLLFPLTLAILPLYIQLRALHLLDTQLGIILPQVAFILPFHIIIFRGFIKQIPNELEDACTIDGYGKFGFLFKIVMPLSGPAIATVGVLAMLYSWNNYFLPLVVVNDKDKFTLPMGSMDYIGQYMSEWNQILAFFTICMIPAIIFYIFAQKYIVSGLTAGAIKG
jgi:raffinose/stachyose/melibiose transport system permease protein